MKKNAEKAVKLFVSLALAAFATTIPLDVYAAESDVYTDAPQMQTECIPPDDPDPGPSDAAVGEVTYEVQPAAAEAPAETAAEEEPSSPADEAEQTAADEVPGDADDLTPADEASEHTGDPADEAQETMDEAAIDPESSEAENELEINGVPVRTMASSPAMLSAAGGSAAEAPSALQSMIDNAMKSVTGTLSGKLQVVLAKDTTYEGEVTVSGEGYTVADDFALELTTEDAGDDGLQSDGSSKFTGNLFIRSIAVILKGLDMPGKVEVSGEKGSFDYYGSTMDDTINVTVTDHASAGIHGGDGDDTVTISVNTGGTADIQTGAGDDTVKGTAEGGSITVDTGADFDTVDVTVGTGGTASVETGAGNDTVNLDVRPGWSGAAVSTGADNDTVSVKNGGDKAENPVGEVTIEPGDGSNKIEIDLSLADAVKKIAVKGIDGSGNSLNLTGTLKKDDTDDTYNPISGTEKNMNLTAESGKVLNLVTENVGSFTDTLENKHTVTLTSNKDDYAYVADQPFTNYVLKATTGSLGSVKIISQSGKLPLSAVVIDTASVMSFDDKLTVKSGADFLVRGLALILRGKDIVIDGTLRADSVLLEATDGTGAHQRSIGDYYSAHNKEENFFSAGFDALGDAAAELINVNNRASITIGKDAAVYSAGDVILRAVVQQQGGMISLLSGINLVNVKLADAVIDIAGRIYAGYDFDRFKLGDSYGSVLADARTSVSIGYDADGKELNGMPLAISVALGDASVNVAQGAELYAARDIELNSAAEQKIYTRADSGILSSVAPIALAVSVLTNDASTVVDGLLDAGGDIRVFAAGNVQATGIADKGESHDNASGGFLSVAVVLQDAVAKLGEHAIVTAGGSVSVFSTAKEKIDNRAASATQNIDKAEKEEGLADTLKDTGIKLLTDKVLPWVKEKLHEWRRGDEYIKNEKLTQAVSKIAASNKSIQIDEAAEKHADIKIDLDDSKEHATEKEDHTAANANAFITITPHSGYKVKAVWWRGYNAGESSYTVQDISDSNKLDGKYLVQFQKQFITLFVEYETDDGISVVDELEGVWNSEPSSDNDNLDLEALLDDVQNSADDHEDQSVEDMLREIEESAEDNDEDEEEEPSVELKLTGEGGGAVLNYKSDPDDKTKSYLKAEPGDELRLIPNPADGKTLKQGGLTVTYKVKEDDKEVTKTVIVNADEKGRYFFTVPEDIILSEGLAVKAVFVDSGSKDAAADTTQTQVTGAIAVVVADNDSSAVIDDGASVTAGGSMTVDSKGKTNIKNVADGTAVSDKSSSAGGSDANYTIKRDESKIYSGFDAEGRQYGLVIETVGEGVVTSAAIANVNNAYTFTAAPEAGYSVGGVTLVYYVDGKRQTSTLTADDSGKYTVNLNSVTDLDKGSVAQISVAFVKDGEDVTESGESRTTAVIPNPIKLSYNGQKQGKGTDETFIEVGKIYYKGATVNADGSISGYVFEAAPKDTWLLDGALKAVWKDMSGAAHTAELAKNSDGMWVLDPASIPTGALITVSASFKDDFHAFETTGTIENGTVTLYDKQIKATDKPKVTVKPNAGYSVEDIAVTYTGRDGASATTKLTLSGHSITQAKDKDNNPIDDLYEFTLPDNIYAGSAVSITATFKAKTINLYTGSGADSKDVTLSEYNVAVGDKVTVTPSADKLKEGYKVSKVTVTDANGTTVAESSDGSFTVPTDKNIADNASLTVTAELKLREIEIKGAELTNGKVEPQSGRGDRGEVMTVNVTPDDGYRIKTGTLKAVVKAKDGSYSSEVFVDRKNDTTYTFVMPSDISDPSKITVTFAGEFIPGQSDNSAYETSLGAGIAVTVANAESLSAVRGGVESAGNVKVKSKDYGAVSTEAKAGYSKTNTGFAGAIAVQIASIDSKALVYNTADVKLDGDLKISSDAKPTFNVKADASGNKDAGKVGIGAGIAVAVNGSDSFAAVQDGTKLSSKTKDKNIRGISITAEQELGDTVSAKAGAAGGTAAVPVAAVDVNGSSAIAYFGKVQDTALTLGDGSGLTGNVAVSGKNEAEHTVTADASAAGKGAGIGAAIAVSVLSDSAEARLNQSLNANQVTVATETAATVNETATASAQGGKKDGGSADQKADGLLGSAGKLAGKNKSSSVSGSKVDNAITNRQQAETSEGSVGVAGAVVVNVQDSVSCSEIMDGVDVNAAGLVAVTSVNGTTSKVKANASTTNSNIGVGVGAAVNIVNIENNAYLGNGELKAAELKVSATTLETKPDEEKKVTAKAATYDDLAEQLSELVEEYISNLIKEMGLDQYGLSDELLGEILGNVTKEVAQTLIDATGLRELFGDGDLSAKFDKAMELLTDAKDGLMSLPEKLIEPFMEAFGDAYDLSSLSTDDLIDLKDNVIDNFRAKFVEQLEASGKSVLEGVKDGLNDYLKDNGVDLFSGLFTGHFKENVGKVFSLAKDELVKAVKKQLKNLVVDTFRETVRTISIPGITNKNVDTAVDAFKGAKNAYTAGNIDNILSAASGYVTDTFRTEVFDYQKMITTLSETDFASKIQDTLLAAAKKASVTLTNSAIAALSDHFDLKLEAENDPTGHVIDTQAISGAGARDVGIAGSVAVTVLNANTTAKIAESDKDVNVTGDVTVEAKELRSVKNVASAALDANGNASANKSADDEANADVAAGSNTVSGKHVTLDISAGADASIREADKNTDKPRIYVTVKEGYKLPSTVSYSYTGTDGQEKTGTIAVTRSGDEYVIDPKSGDLAGLDADVDVRLKLVPEEILYELPDVSILTDQALPADTASIKVAGREAENGKWSAREGDVVELVIKKTEGHKITELGYSFTDEAGKNHDVEIIAGTDIDPNDLNGKEKTYTLKINNASEYIYTIRVPKGTITAFVVQIEEGEEDEAEDDASETSAKDGTGKSVGVGAAFSMVYGDTHTVAEIGQRGSFTAGSLAVTAESEHKEDVASAAGSDPLEGDWDADATKDIALDASVALNILDNDIRAVVAPGMNVTVTEGDLTVTAVENSETETTASAFSVGESTAVGASVALNIANSTVRADMLSNVTVPGNAEVAALTHSEDVTKAIATAMGGDIGRTMAKIGNAADSMETGANKVLDGSYIDSMGKSSSNKKGTDTNKRINQRLKEKKGSEGQDVSDSASASTNALRSQGVSTESEDAGSEGTEEAGDQIADHTDSVIGSVGGQTGTKVQVAAAVGVTVAAHEASVNTAAITAGKDIKAAAENTGNFNTMGTGAAMSFAKRANSIALGVAVSVNNNKATVSTDGDLISNNKGDITLSADLTQNMDGDFLGKLAAQALSGSVAGKDSAISLGGAISVVVSNAESSVNVAGSHAVTGGDVVIEATDKSKLAARAGGLSLSKGSSVGMGIASTTVVSGNTVTATVGDGVTVNADSFKLNAEKKAVTDDDFKQLIDMRYLITDSSELSDEQRKEANTGLIDVHKGAKDDSYKVEVNLSEEKLLEAVDALNFLSSQNTYAEAIAGSVATGKTKANLAGSFAVAVTDNDVRALLGNNVTILTGSGTTQITALDGATTRVIAGSLSAAPAKASVGATVAVLVNGDAAHVKAGTNLNIRTGGSIDINAAQTGDTQVFTGAMAVAAGTQAKAAAGGAVNVLVNKSTALVELGDKAYIRTMNSDTDIDIRTGAEYDLMLISGSANVVAGTGNVAAGGTVNVIVDKVAARTILGDNVTVIANRHANIASDVSDQMISGALSASAALSATGKSGAGAVNVLVSKSAAETTVGSGAMLQAWSGDLHVDSSNDAWMLNATMAAAGSTETAIGGSFNINVFDREAAVNMIDGTLISGGDMYVRSSGRDTTVLAGLAVAGSVTGSALTSNVEVLAESSRINTVISDGVTAEAGGNAIFEAYYSDYTVDAAGTIAVSAASTAAGVTSLTVVKENDVETLLAASKLLALGTEDAETLSGEKAHGVYVGANASETQFLGAAGVAVAGGTTVNGVVDVLVNHNTVKADASKAELDYYRWKYDTFYVRWQTTEQASNRYYARNAENHNQFQNHLNALVDGSLNYVKYMVDGQLYTVDKDHLVFPLLCDYSSAVTVKAADDTQQLLLAGGVNIGAGAGVGASVVTLVSGKDVQALAGDMTANGEIKVMADNSDDVTMIAVSAGAAGSAAVQIGAAVQVMDTKAIALAGGKVNSANGGVAITADNNTDLMNAAAAVAGGGSAAVAPVGVVTYFTGETEAKLLTGSTVSAAKDVDIKANADKNIDLYSLGAAIGGAAGVSGTANVAVTKDSATAVAESGTRITSTNGGLNIETGSDYALDSETGVLAVAGAAGVGVNAVVSVIKSSTVAEMGGTASLGGDLNVKASGSRDVTNAAINLAGGTVGAGVNVMVLAAGEKMSQDAADMLTYGNSDNKNGARTFDTAALMNTIAKGDNGGSKYYADDLNASVLAEDTAGNGHYESKESVGGTSGSGDDKKGTFDGASGYRSSDFDSENYNDDGETQRGEKMEASDTKDIANAKQLNVYTKAASTDVVLATVTQNAVIEKAKDVNVIASQPVVVDLLGVTASGGAVGAGVTTAVAMLHSNVIASSLGDIRNATGSVNVTAESKAGGEVSDQSDALKKVLSDIDPERGGIRAIGASMAGGTVGVAVGASVVLTDNVTRANLGGAVNAAGAVNVNAIHDYGHVTAAVGTLGAGAVAVGASVAVAQTEGEVSAKIADKAAVTAGGDVRVSTDSNVDASAYAATAGGGAVAVNAGVALAINRLEQTTGIGDGATVTGKNIYVTATSDTGADSGLLGVSVGGVGVALGAAVSQVDAKLDTEVKNATLTAAGGTVEVYNDVSSTAKPRAISLAGGGVAAGGNVLLAFNETQSNAKVTGSTVTADNFNLAAGMEAEASSKLTAAQAGLVTVGLSVNYADLQAFNRAMLENSTVNVKNLTVQTGRDGHNVTKAEAETTAGDAGAVTAGLNTAIARNHSRSYAVVEGGSVTATDSILVHGDQAPIATAGFEGVSAAGINVAGNVAVALNDADTRTSVRLDSLTAGDAEFTVDHNGETTGSVTLGGGSLLEVKTSVAATYGRSGATVDVNIGKLTASSLSAVTNAGNTVKSTVTNKTDFSAVSATAVAGAAYSQDVFDTRVQIGKDSVVSGDIEVLNNYNMDVVAEVNPSAGGLDAKLAKVTTNVAIARSTAYAGSDLIIGDGSSFAEVKAQNVTVKTEGSASAKADILPTEITIAAASLGVNVANADLSANQAATIHLKPGATLTASGDVNVRSNPVKAEAVATLGNPGAKNKSIKLSLMDVDLSFAHAKENLTSTAGILGETGNIITRYYDVYQAVKSGNTGRSGGSGTTTRYVFIERITEEEYQTNYNSNYRYMPIFETKTGTSTVNAADVNVISMGYHVEQADRTRAITVPMYNVYDRATLPSDPNAPRYYIDWCTEEELAERGYLDNGKYLIEKSTYGKVVGYETYTVDVEVPNQSLASASSNGAETVSLLALGNLEAKATASDSFNTVLKGVTINASGDAEIRAQANTVSRAYGAAPGGFQLINGGISNTYANIGSASDRNSVNVLVDDGVKLTANSVKIEGYHYTDVKSTMEKKTNYSVAEIGSSRQPTETWLETNVILGKNVEITAYKSNLRITGDSNTKAYSWVNNENTGLLLNVNTMKGENKLDEIMNVCVGDYSKLKYFDNDRGVFIYVNTVTDMTAGSVYNGSFSVFDAASATANNSLNRVQNLLLGRGVEISSEGWVSLGNAMGCADKIYTYVYMKSGSSLVNWANTDAETDVTMKGCLDIGPAVKITANDRVGISAPLLMNYTNESNLYANEGLSLETEPVANGNMNVDVENYINLNVGNAGEANRLKLTSKESTVYVRAVREGTANTKDLYTYSIASAAGVFGGVYSWANTLANIKSVITVDNTDFVNKLGTELTVDLGNFGIYDRSAAGLSGAGWESPTAKIRGALVANILTTLGKSTVSGGSKFTHVASNTGHLEFGVSAFGWDTSIGNRDLQNNLGLNTYCVFCDRTASAGGSTNTATTGTGGTRTDPAAALRSSMSKALAAVNDISRMVDGLDPITKARYGEEDDQIASGIYVLDISSVLEKDVRLTGEQLTGYRLWTDAITQHDVTLLPNATRLYNNAAGRLEFVSEVLQGDVLGNGEIHKIDVFTALTGYAFQHPTVPIGSSGALEMDTGMLTIPAQAEFELYLYEVSSKWFIEQLETGFIRRLDADQDAINAFARGEGELPEGEIAEGLIPDGEQGGWKLYWVGDSPETAKDADQVLVFLLVNEETDEVDAYRTSLRMIATDEAPVDVSVYFYRDSRSDRMGIEKYNVLFYDTAEGEESLVVLQTDVPEDRDMDMPMALEIVLRRFYIGADLPAYSLTGHFFAMMDGSDGYVSLFDGFYEATVGEDTFESDYIRVDGISGGSPQLTIKAGQDIWPEWTGEDTAGDIAENRFELIDDLWYPVEDAPEPGYAA